MSEQMQTIILTLSDGSKHSFTGPAAIFEGGPEVILPIVATEPKDMPTGCRWEHASELEAK